MRVIIVPHRPIRQFWQSMQTGYCFVTVKKWGATASSLVPPVSSDSPF